MPDRPDDTNPEPPGGRAAERLREFMNERFPEGLPPEQSPLPDALREQADEQGDRSPEGPDEEESKDSERRA